MYDRAITIVKTTIGETSEFPITVGFHQGSALSPYLFALVIDELTKYIQDDIPLCMLFADDIVLIDKTKSRVNAKLDVQREVLESKGFKISRTKTEYIKCNFNENRNTNDEIVKIASQEIRKSKKIRYLGSIIQQEGEIGEDVNHRVKAEWAKWRSASRVLYD